VKAQGTQELKEFIREGLPVSVAGSRKFPASLLGIEIWEVAE
jgi:hypothetical protein